MAGTDTVVLVMTDVVGSTRLWQDAPEFGAGRELERLRHSLA